MFRLTGGPFELSHEATAKYLLTLEPERLLAGFRVNSGLVAKPRARFMAGGKPAVYPDTPSATTSLHALRSTPTPGIRDTRTRLTPSSTALQSANKTVQMASFAPFGLRQASIEMRLDKIWADVKAGNLRSGGFDLNGMWSPWYVHHKVLAGLLDAQAMCKNDKALEVAKKFADWAINETKDLDAQHWQRMLGTEYGGMNDCLAELYSRTKDHRYLELVPEVLRHQGARSAVQRTRRPCRQAFQYPNPEDYRPRPAI